MMKSRETNLGVKLIVAQIERCVDGLERLEIDVNQALFAFIRDDCAAIDNQTVIRN